MLARHVLCSSNNEQAEPFTAVNVKEFFAIDEIVYGIQTIKNTIEELTVYRGGYGRTLYDDADNAPCRHLTITSIGK